MLCSISTGKSGSNWLDRLRSSKGFPTADNHDLDHFLNNRTNPDPNPNPNLNPSDSPINNASNSLNSNSELTRSADNPKVPREIKISTENGEREWLGIMSNVLSELFNMGDANESSSLSGKKSSRKQTKPKFCVIPASQNYMEAKSSDCVREGEDVQAAPVSLNSDNHSVETKNLTKEENVDVDAEEVAKEKGDRELLGYSRSEVTVIDTSRELWKFEKLVFRRKNVWKVRDKKGKSRIVGRKKRKGSGSDGNVVGKKKARVSGSESGSLREANEVECILPSSHGENTQDDKREEACNETTDDASQVPKKRFPFSRSPRKSRKGGSSVILIKGIPASNKGGSNFSKSSLKDTQKRYKA